MVADLVRMQVNAGKLLGHHVEQAGFGQLVDLGVKLKALKDVAHRRAEGLHVCTQVLTNVVLVAHELLQVQRRGVVEKLARFAQQKGLRVQAGGFAGGFLSQHLGLGGLQHTVQPAQHGKRQDHLAILALLVVAAQQVGDGPNEGG